MSCSPPPPPSPPLPLPPPPPPPPPPPSASSHMPPPLHPPRLVTVDQTLFSSPPTPIRHNHRASSITTSSSPLSTLTSLLSYSTSTLNSFSTLLPLSNPNFLLLPCPFNPNHHLPPSSLFSHYLKCPSSPSPLDPTSLLSTLHYPLTLKHLKPTSIISDSPTDLTISLKDHCHFLSNFFYLDCPGLVTFSSPNSPLPDLIFPKILSSQCADFVDSNSSDVDGMMIFSACDVRILVSESWAIRNEIEMWNDFPDLYSYCVVRGFLLLNMCGLEDFGIWVATNSPRFGVVIDLAMAGHIVLLVFLCLKAIVREAFELVCGLMNIECKGKGLNSERFSCPVLSRVMMWLASQLAILYGEGNGKSFAINMLKQCLSANLCNSSFFSVKNEVNESEDLKGVGMNYEKPITIHKENVEKCSSGGKICSSVVFVSQVASGVAALYERQMLEAKIRALWDSRPPSTYERIMEHQSICMAAEIERQKRPNYRPLIEHDGLFRQQSHSQDSNKKKTREEILAEERDYKRRRTSYRGKKGKRSTTEVMRDIIKEHMEELKHGREMECSGSSAKNIEDKQDLESITYTGQDHFSTNMYQQTVSLDFSSKLARGQQHNYGELSRSHSKAVAESTYEFLDSKQYRQKSNNHLNQESDRSTTIDRAQREQYTRRPVDQQSRCQEVDHSVSPLRRRNRYERSDSSRSPNKKRRKYKRDISITPDGHSSKRDSKYISRSPNRRLSSHHRHVSDEQIQDEKLIRGISSHASEKSHIKKGERNSHRRDDREHKIEVRNKSRAKTHQPHKSTSESYDRYDSFVEYNKFEDRYDPSESYGA